MPKIPPSRPRPYLNIPRLPKDLAPSVPQEPLTQAAQWNFQALLEAAAEKRLTVVSCYGPYSNGHCPVLCIEDPNAEEILRDGTSHKRQAIIPVGVINDGWLTPLLANLRPPAAYTQPGDELWLFQPRAGVDSPYSDRQPPPIRRAPLPPDSEDECPI